MFPNDKMRDLCIPYMEDAETVSRKLRSQAGLERLLWQVVCLVIWRELHFGFDPPRTGMCLQRLIHDDVFFWHFVSEIDQIRDDVDGEI